MMPIKVLVIEDDKFVARTIERCLRGDQFQLTLATNGADGLQLARQSAPDLVILDVIMRGMDGYAVCRAMRADPLLESVPVLFLTAKIKPEDKLTGFRAGADDYLCKPFNLDELILRIQAILRRSMGYEFIQPVLPIDSSGGKTRSGGLAPGRAANRRALASGPVYLAHTDSAHRSLVVGDYILDTYTFELQTPKRGKVRLTPLQYDLLYHMMTHPGETFSPSRLLNEVWDYPSGKGSPDLVRVHIKTLRKRIEQDPGAPEFLLTIPGKGYTVNFTQNHHND